MFQDLIKENTVPNSFPSNPFIFQKTQQSNLGYSVINAINAEAATLNQSSGHYSNLPEVKKGKPVGIQELQPGVQTGPPANLKCPTKIVGNHPRVCCLKKQRHKRPLKLHWHSEPKIRKQVKICLPAYF